MRVSILKDTKAYWEYAVREFKKGEELLGDLARHLLDNTPEGTVEVLERDPEPEVVEAPAPVEGEDPDEVPDADGPPVDGTIDVLMTWVGEDPERAARALVAEQAKDKPRATVIKRLGGVTAE
jgi:hypothetical protein